MRNPVVGILRSIFAFTTLFAVAGVHAQTKITIETANSVNKQILAVSFAPPAPPGSTTVLNSDQSTVGKILSLALGTNPSTNTIDLFAGDNGNHNVLRYASNFTICTSPPTPPACTVGTPVVPQSTIPYPNGLSLDNAFNLFVVNDQPGSSPTPQVYALSQWNNNTGTFQTVTRIDKPGSLGKMQAVVETMIVPTPLGTPLGGGKGSIASVGDLLVVSQSPNEILIYPGSNGHGPLTQSTLATPTVLIPQCPNKGVQPPYCLPATSAPGGIAVWPADHSLVVTTFNGPILQFPTASGVITAPTTIRGAPSGLTKVNTAINSGEAGGSVGYIAQTGPGNHGSILELTATNTGAIQLSSSTVTANVFAPQAIAVTNTQQAPYANCLVPPGSAPGSTPGCDLLGHNINTYKTRQKSDPSGGPNLVESLCVVAMDPRFLTGGGGCPVPGNTVRINDVCPGVDTTGKNMVVPDYACGTPGFALIKSQTDHTQGEFNLTYTDSLQDPSALFTGVPMCGPGGTAAVFWAPNGDETLIEEEVPPGGSITNPAQPGLTPTLVDTTQGCWGDPGPGGGHPLTSVFATGLAFLPPDLQGFVGKNYGYLQSTITQLATGGNVNSGVASQLTNNSTGCVDVSLSLFNQALHETTPQQTYDFQDAADLLSNADATGTTTCDSILTTSENNPANFTENQATQVFNPSGQIEWRFAEISNAIRMRILGQPPAATWPTPVSLSVSPQYLFGQCSAPQGCPVPTQTPNSATLSWALVSGANSCSWTGTNGDPSFNLSSPPNASGNPPNASGSQGLGPYTPPAAGNPAVTYTYELTCYVPASTVPSNTVTLTAAPSGSGYMGGTLTAKWPGSTGVNYQVTLYDGATPPNPIQTISPCTFTNNSTAFSCPSTNITGTPTATIEVSSPFSTSTYLTVWPAIAIQASPSAVAAGTTVTIAWAPPAGATTCSLITSGNPGPGGFTGATSGNSGGTATYIPSPADEGNTVTFTAYCAAGASAGIASITVWPPVVVNVNPPTLSVSGGGSATITPTGGTGCSVTNSNGQGSFTPGNPAIYTPVAADVTSGGMVTFSASCTSGASPGTGQLNVTS